MVHRTSITSGGNLEKRNKKQHPSNVSGGGSANEPPDGRGGTVPPKPNFHSLFTKVEVLQRPRVDLLAANLARIEFEDGNRLKPKVILADSVMEGLCAPWKDALVVKLLGKNIGFITMKERQAQIWKMPVGFEIMDIDNGYFMVKFDKDEDRRKVIEGDPWMIFDHYLTVQVWSPDFISPAAKIERTMVWIRFPGLNLLYYDESILLARSAPNAQNLLIACCFIWLSRNSETFSDEVWYAWLVVNKYKSLMALVQDTQVSDTSSSSPRLGSCTPPPDQWFQCLMFPVRSLVDHINPIFFWPTEHLKELIINVSLLP